MSIIKSNSSLIAFDNSNYKLERNFEFLSYVQSFQLNTKVNNIYKKSIGKQLSDVYQYVSPDIDFTINYLQRNDFFTEFLFGFDISNNDNHSFLHKFSNLNFYNKNALILFSEDNGDLSKTIDSTGFDDILLIALKNIFIKKYNFSYKINELPSVSASFSATNLSISKFEKFNDLIYKFTTPEKEDIFISKNSINDLYDIINISNYSNVTYTVSNFSLSSSHELIEIPGIDLSSFVNSLANSIDFSIDFNRKNVYSFEGEFNNSSFKKLVFPIQASLSINGYSNIINNGNLDLFFKSNKNFNITIDIGGENTDSYYQLIFENLYIDSFSYSIQLNNKLEYSLSSSFEISENSGFKIKQIRTNTDIILGIKSNDNCYLLTCTNDYLTTRDIDKYGSVSGQNIYLCMGDKNICIGINNLSFCNGYLNCCIDILRSGYVPYFRASICSGYASDGTGGYFLVAESNCLFYKAINNNWFDTINWFCDSSLNQQAKIFPTTCTYAVISGNSSPLVDLDCINWTTPKLINACNLTTQNGVLFCSSLFNLFSGTLSGTASFYGNSNLI